MNQQNHHSKNRLGLNLFEANLKRHPSVKGLFDEDGNMKTPSDSKDEYLLLSINNQNENNDTLHYKGVDNDEGQDEGQDEDKENNNKKETMPVQINRVEEKLVNNIERYRNYIITLTELTLKLSEELERIVEEDDQMILQVDQIERLMVFIQENRQILNDVMDAI